jgi:hypothetical protein
MSTSKKESDERKINSREKAQKKESKGGSQTGVAMTKS